MILNITTSRTIRDSFLYCNTSRLCKGYRRESTHSNKTKRRRMHKYLILEINTTNSPSNTIES